MNTNYYGQPIYSGKEILEILYCSRNINALQLANDHSADINQYNSSITACGDSIAKLENPPNVNSIEEFDEYNQKIWFIPPQYKELNIKNWLLSQCQTQREITRVTNELKLFESHKLTDVLLCAKYIVDTMRQHNVIWGVGRGSSVASYCLFLIGIHKVNSLMYNLDIAEFLKDE